MEIIGIIVEYNPFHKGHVNHIKEIKKKYPNSLIIAAMSGNIVQRGELSIFDKFERARTAINNGVDIVVEIPIFFSLNNANIFSHGGVKLLNDFNVQKIIFGSESNDIESLKKISKKMDDEKFKKDLNKEIVINHSLPRAFQKLIDKKIKSNDILGISYINEGSKINKNIEFETILRDNNNFKNASTIRKEIKINNDSEDSLSQGNFFLNEVFFDFFTSSIIGYKGNSDLINHSKKILTNKNPKNWNEFKDLAANKTYTKNRISREVMKLTLNLDFDLQEDYRLLAISKLGQEYLSKNNFNYSVKFKKKYKNTYKVASFINLKYKGYLEKEIKTKVILGN